MPTVPNHPLVCHFKKEIHSHHPVRSGTIPWPQKMHLLLQSPQPQHVHVCAHPPSTRARSGAVYTGILIPKNP